jgi:hypothetical protein
MGCTGHVEALGEGSGPTFFVRTDCATKCPSITKERSLNIHLISIISYTHQSVQLSLYKSTLHITSATFSQTPTLAVHITNKISRYEGSLLLHTNIRHHIININIPFLFYTCRHLTSNNSKIILDIQQEILLLIIHKHHHLEPILYLWLYKIILRSTATVKQVLFSVEPLGWPPSLYK